MAVDEFIGSIFGKNGQITVVSWDGSRDQSHTKIYTVHCSECAKDPELFGPALFRSQKSRLTRGAVPCGCSFTPQWTQEQNITRIKRKCKERAFEFLGEVSEYNGVHTRIRLMCLEFGHEWEASTRVFLEGSGCPHCQRQNQKTPDNEMVGMFMSTGGFLEGTTFTRSDEVTNTFNQKPFWTVTCPVCSVDEYVQAGLCSGVFRGHYGSMRRGCAPCRCGHTHSWTKEQREFQIRKKIDETNLPYKLIGWDTKPYNKRTGPRVVMECDTHGVWYPTLNNFLNNDRRCPGCAKHGFKPYLPASFYVLDTGTFTGFGISNDIKTRLRAHRNSLSKEGLKILRLESFDMSGTDARKLEHEVKGNFEITRQEILGFMDEATHQSSYEAVVSFCSSWLTDLQRTALPVL